MSQLPNLLTGGRLVLTLVVFGCLLAAGEGSGAGLAWTAFVAFAVAAVTDFFDGWLARRYGVVSLLGEVLDPIADKVLVAGAIVGLLAAAPDMNVAAAGGLILFREFAVSAMREVLAPRGLRLPVTFLAKSKTALQLVSLALTIAAVAYALGAQASPAAARALASAHALLWVAAAVTVWTGVQYALAARTALGRQTLSRIERRR